MMRGKRKWLVWAGVGLFLVALLILGVRLVHGLGVIVLGSAVGSVFSLLVAGAVFFVTRYYTKNDSKADLTAVLAQEREKRKEERGLLATQAIREAMAPIGPLLDPRFRLYDPSFRKPGGSDILNEHLLELKRVVHIEHVWLFDDDRRALDAMTDTVDKWRTLKFPEKPQRLDDLNAHLSDVSVYLTKRMYGLTQPPPRRPDWV